VYDCTKWKKLVQYSGSKCLRHFELGSFAAAARFGHAARGLPAVRDGLLLFGFEEPQNSTGPIAGCIEGGQRILIQKSV
jgi:hypothetical protein